MYWHERPDPYNWIEQIRYFSNDDNELYEDELRDAFIHLALLYVIEFSNQKVLEDAIFQALGHEKAERLLESIERWSPEGMDLTEIVSNEGDMENALKITLNMCDYIEDHWFPNS